MQVEKLSKTLYKLTLSLDGNDFPVNLVASIGPDGILLVDTGWAQTAEDLNNKIRELSDGIVKLILITHPHGDHIGGRHLLGEKATLIAHKSTKDELAGKYFALDPLPGQELPIITLEDELSLRFNGEEIQIFPAPGHTHSDMAVHFIDSGVVCLGDIILSDMFPPLDFARGGNVEQYIQSIGKLIERFPADVKFVTGHGRDYTLDDLKEHYRMVVGSTDLIRQGITAEKNAQDMLDEDVLKAWAKWDNPQVTAETWVTQAYESLSGQAKKSIAEPLTYTIVEKGIGAAIEQNHALKKDQPDAYNFGENELNMLGYQLLWREMTEAAIEIFKLNTQAYPESANPYDSLGDAYEASGEIELAIEAYEKALEINPDMPSSIEALKKLRVGSEE
jgi:cyclase